MVDPDAPVTRTSARCVWEPMVPIMIYNERAKLGLGTIKHGLVKPYLPKFLALVLC